MNELRTGPCSAEAAKHMVEVVVLACSSRMGTHFPMWHTGSRIPVGMALVFSRKCSSNWDQDWVCLLGLVCILIIIISYNKPCNAFPSQH